MKKKLICVFAAALLLFTGCASETEKNAVRDGFEKYFAFLKDADYGSANAIAFDADESDSIVSDITSGAVNDYIFKKVSYEIWGITKDGDKLNVDVVITQISLASAYASSAAEFAEYISQAEKTGKEFSKSAMDKKFDELLYNSVQKEENFASFRCTVPCIIQDGALRIGMTDRFRNALFGGELDAINSMEKIGE